MRKMVLPDLSKKEVAHMRLVNYWLDHVTRVVKPAEIPRATTFQRRLSFQIRPPQDWCLELEELLTVFCRSIGFKVDCVENGLLQSVLHAVTQAMENTTNTIEVEIAVSGSWMVMAIVTGQSLDVAGAETEGTGFSAVLRLADFVGFSETGTIAYLGFRRHQ